MERENQILVGYIIYEIYELKSEWQGETQHHITSPSLSWKKKIYQTLTSAQEELTHIEQNEWRHGIIIPIYANLEDLGKASEKFKELKEINKK
jgi:hypothetical protein